MPQIVEATNKFIYNVKNCAGITDTSTSGENMLDMCTKIKNWVNSDETLSELFTASVITVTDGSRYRVELLTNTGAGVVWGQGGSSSICYRYYRASPDDLTGSDSVTIGNLRLMVIKGEGGFIAGFYDVEDNTSTEIGFIHTTGRDSGNVYDEVSIVLNSYNIYSNVSGGSCVTDSFFMQTDSTSSSTGLFTLMLPKRDLICEGVRLCMGNKIGNQAFFEAGGKTWCCIYRNSSYKGLALCIG